MTISPTVADTQHSPVRDSWFDRPLSQRWCVVGWLSAAAVFFGLIQLLGGVSQNDAFESVFSTWAIAHGHLSCAYPPGSADGFPFLAPLYPLLSGGLAAVTRIGHSVPFPSQGDLGSHCSSAVAVMSRWSAQTNALSPTVHLGYLSWLVLMAGLIAFLRASGRGRCGWEPTTLILVACVPPVFMCIQRFFHPEDLLAMGLILGGLACVRRGWWVWAGVLLGLAVTSQPFALLVLAPLMVVAPVNRRVRFTGSAIGAAAIVVVPLIVMTAGRVIKAITGPGYQAVTEKTVLADTHLHGPLLFVPSRIVPIILAAALAWWALRRLGPRVLEPVSLVSLIATSLSFRLIFEVNLYGYYFMAVALLLVVLDVLYGRIGVRLVAWLALVTLVFDPLPWGNDPLTHALPLWLWQTLLVPIAVAMAARPLITARPEGSYQGLVVRDDRGTIPADT
jgi:hypothetical protein